MNNVEPLYNGQVGHVLFVPYMEVQSVFCIVMYISKLSIMLWRCLLLGVPIKKGSTVLLFCHSSFNLHY